MKVFFGIAILLVAGFGAYVWSLPAEPEVPPIVVDSEEEHKEEDLAVQEPMLTLSSDEVAQGEVLIVTARGPVTGLRVEGEAVTLAELGGGADSRKVAVIGFDTRAALGARTLRYETPNGTETKTFHVVKREYPVTRIVVPEKLAEEGVTSGDLAESIAATDNVTLADIIDVETEQYRIKEWFVEPTDEWVNVGGFGTVRADQYGSIRHLGVDLEGETGDPVYVTNDGVVVFAGDLQNYGNSVVIDHGVGIFSIYLHLSSIETSAGARVDAGERIARIGNTGAYTLAPHLHFSIKVHGVSVDPRAFIDTFNAAL